MSLEGHVNASGYPLQIAVESVINSQTQNHGFSVLYREHAWRSENGRSEGFADLVLSYTGDVIHFVVECKRVLDAEWTFLVENDAQMKRRQAKGLAFRRSATKRIFDWFEMPMDPRSPESMFCAIPGASGGGRPIIERSAAELVEATEAIAAESLGLVKENEEATQIYFPLLVTTAKLQACTYKPEEISLATGKIGNPLFKEVPFVRFRKQLSPTYKLPALNSLRARREIARAKENTVFVVNSERITEFLDDFNLDTSGDIRRYLMG